MAPKSSPLRRRVCQAARDSIQAGTPILGSEPGSELGARVLWGSKAYMRHMVMELVIMKEKRVIDMIQLKKMLERPSPFVLTNINLVNLYRL